MIKKYSTFMIESRQDNILDKILSQGIETLSDDEKKFLDSHKDGKEEEVDKDLSIRDGDLPLESNEGLFEFDVESVEVYEGEGASVIGTLAYYGGLYFGKFVFDTKGNLEYWMFESAEDNLEEENPNFDIYEFEYKLDHNDHSYYFDEFCKKIHEYYIKEIIIK